MNHKKSLSSIGAMIRELRFELKEASETCQVLSEEYYESTLYELLHLVKPILDAAGEYPRSDAAKKARTAVNGVNFDLRDCYGFSAPGYQILGEDYEKCIKGCHLARDLPLDDAACACSAEIIVQDEGRKLKAYGELATGKTSRGGARKKSGRKANFTDDEVKEMAEGWVQAKNALIKKAVYAQDMGMTEMELDNLILRRANRLKSTDK